MRSHSRILMDDATTIIFRMRKSSLEWVVAYEI
jgi:hypothetical protein